MRFGCRSCGTPLPAVQAGEPLRVRCVRRNCQFVNVIPADPELAPWETRGGSELLVIDDPKGAVLLAPKVVKKHRYGATLAVALALAAMAIVSLPPVRHRIIYAVALHEIQTTHDAATAASWTTRLAELGPMASPAAPALWSLHSRRFDDSKAISESFINSSVNSIAPGYIAAKSPVITSSTPTAQLIADLYFPEPSVRVSAIKALKSRPLSGYDIVPQLTVVAGRAQDPAALEAMEALGEIGPPAKTAVRVLIKQLGISGASKAAAAKALLQISPEDPQVISALDQAGIASPETRDPVSK